MLSFLKLLKKFNYECIIHSIRVSTDHVKILQRCATAEYIVGETLTRVCKQEFVSWQQHTDLGKQWHSELSCY